MNETIEQLNQSLLVVSAKLYHNDKFRSFPNVLASHRLLLGLMDTKVLCVVTGLNLKTMVINKYFTHGCVLPHIRYIISNICRPITLSLSPATRRIIFRGVDCGVVLLRGCFSSPHTSPQSPRGRFAVVTSPQKVKSSVN